MKKYVENGIPIIEYDFNDWEVGIVSTSWFKYPGKQLLIDSSTREKHYDYITEEEFNKIQEACKTLLRGKIKEVLIYQKKHFKIKLNKSRDRTRLIANEIERLETMFGLRESNSKHKAILHYETMYKELYEKVIINGEKLDHTLTNSENFQFNVGRDNHIVHFAVDWYYWNWLKNKFDPTRKTVTDQKTLSLKQIAVKYIYERNQITSDNANSIAKKYGHTSGHKLYQHFNKYQRTENRTGDQGSKVKMKSFLELLESIQGSLELEAEKWLADELKIIRNIYEKYYN